ncbi:glycosyl hydrolase family 18 protein [Nocardioides caldifontis]|uniref:glycosyl hydrolase family 18 protein n=1 Tax=Nocardioides caldifontis TaxID=2588938 RepID=UPI0013969CE9|nr:glycosyl hydrolase family 18 protein [Nocardioides caldifontis]
MVDDITVRRVKPSAGSTTVAPPPPSSTEAGLIRPVRGIYWTNWGRDTPLDSLPSEYNLLYAAFAYGDGSGTGRAVFRPDDGSGVSAAEFARQVRVAQTQGRRVVLSIGGANPVGLRMETQAHVDQLVSSVSSIVDTYGFDGIDWDLEQAGTFSADTLTAATRAFTDRYGPEFIVTAAPSPSSAPYKEFARRVGDDLDLITPQYYGYVSADRVADIRWRTFELIETYGVAPYRIGFGAKVGNDALTSPVGVWRDAVIAMQHRYPDFGGAMVWDATAERLAGNPFATTVSPAFH